MLHGVLTDHRVDDEQDLIGVHRLADVGRLLHELGIDTKATGGVDDHDVVLLTARILDAVMGDLHRVADAVAGLGCEDGAPGLLRDDLELVDGVRTLQVGRDQQRCVSVTLELLGELASEGRLTGPLQTGEHDHGRRRSSRTADDAALHRGSARVPR